MAIDHQIVEQAVLDEVETRIARRHAPPDGSENLKQSGQVISFYHESSRTTARFKAFITAFNETFNSDWASEKVYGRMDPIMMFKNTERQVTLAFKIPAFSAAEAIANMTEVQKLISFLYPNYESQTPSAAVRGEEGTANEGRVVGQTQTAAAPYAQNISNSPLVRLRVVNFLSSEIGMNKNDDNASKGTLGAISNFVVNYNLDAIDGVIEDADLGILPKLIDVNLSFTVLHEKPLGWDNSNQFMSPGFPYNTSEALPGEHLRASIRRDVLQEWEEEALLPEEPTEAHNGSPPSEEPGVPVPSEQVEKTAYDIAREAGLLEDTE